MSVPIVIATFLALLIAGGMINRTESRRSEIVIEGGKQYNWIEKGENANTVVLGAPQSDTHSVMIIGRGNTGNVIGNRRFALPYRVIEISTNYSNRNIQQTVCMSVK